MPDMQSLFQTVAQFAFAVILAIVPVLIRYYAPVVKAWLKSKAQDAQWAVVINAALDVVKQVEQLKKSGLIADNATAKKWAVETLSNWLLLRGLDLPLEDLATAVESAVNDLPHADPCPDDDLGAEGAQQ
jgi:hypothetical protein